MLISAQYTVLGQSQDDVITPELQNATHGFADISSPIRYLQDDVVDDYAFEDGDDDVEDYNPKMAPANTQVDDDKSSNIKKYSVSTESELVRMLW